MTVNVPTRTPREGVDHAARMVAEGASGAADDLGALAERAADLGHDREFRTAAERVTDGTVSVLADFDGAGARDRAATVAVGALVVMIALVIVVAARRRRAARSGGSPSDPADGAARQD